MEEINKNKLKEQEDYSKTILDSLSEVEDGCECEPKEEQELSFDSKESFVLELPSGFKLTLSSSEHDVFELADLSYKVFDYYRNQNGGKRNETSYTG